MGRLVGLSGAVVSVLGLLEITSDTISQPMASLGLGMLMGICFVLVVTGEYK